MLLMGQFLSVSVRIDVGEGKGGLNFSFSVLIQILAKLCPLVFENMQ
jgi:hypothetical protein